MITGQSQNTDEHHMLLTKGRIGGLSRILHRKAAHDKMNVQFQPRSEKYFQPDGSISWIVGKFHRVYNRVRVGFYG